MVKAVDKNGNERISTLTPEMSVFVEFTRPTSLLFGTSIVVLFLMLVLFVIFKRKKISENVVPKDFYEK
jgi:hypothetical protein